MTVIPVLVQDGHMQEEEDDVNMDRKQEGHAGHLWMMILCCAVMFAGIFWSLKTGASPWWLMIIACPLMYTLMMSGHGGGHCGKHSS